jgi:ATP-dependent helicase/nuclease subunit A
VTSGLVVPFATARDQRRAADPAASAWVSANAGSGKTKVLTDRVIRLLLAGTPPSRILCLTFTKAAAANMTIRVFEQLGRWVTLDDLKLGETLAELTGERPAPALLKAARRLFARAIETPGGLKLETIHAFCERVLHLVPFEANVPARFAVLDESKTDELLALARGRVLIEAASGAPGREDLTAAMNVVGLDASGDTLTGLLDAAVRHEGVPSDPDELRLRIARLRYALGLAADEEAGDIRRAMLEDGIRPAEWPEIARELRRTRSSTDAKRADALDAAASAGRPTRGSRLI